MVCVHCGLGGSVSEFAGEWVRSSFCEAGACVEVSTVNGEVLIRDGKHVDQPHLRFTAAEWSAFLDGIIAGDFRLT